VKHILNRFEEDKNRSRKPKRRHRKVARGGMMMIIWKKCVTELRQH
jgi:hypothetical protein